ncbi:MAG: enoyl-CoA hydratase/isomerase family protein [Myxococcota bacterium]|nr:enoyl-CoA hydratase/isomerase family protein [Myxococcota bacterium]
MEDLDYAGYLRELARDDRTRVRVERPDPAWAVVRLDDPENHNALSGPLTVQLQAALEGLVADPALRALVLTGTGDFFSVGGDWKLMRERAHGATQRAEGTPGLWRWIRRQFGGIARTLAGCDAIVVSALNGDAAGVALAWALASDVVLAAEDARLVTAFARIGLVPEVGTSWILTRRLGYAGALEVVLRGDPLSAAEARELGLVNEVVPRAELEKRARAWCERVTALPDHVPAMSKALLRAAADMSWPHALVTEEFAEPGTFTTRAHRERIEALLAGRARALGR